jgi:hypothetical protein
LNSHDNSPHAHKNHIFYVMLIVNQTQQRHNNVGGSTESQLLARPSQRPNYFGQNLPCPPNVFFGADFLWQLESLTHGRSYNSRHIGIMYNI